MIIVSDTSPITNLAAIGQLDLLRQLYRAIKPLIDQLIATADFRVSQKLYAIVLQSE
ncbi:hypothetical protein [Nostoc sp. UHCC 0251]|uniref:hypothetical protein n=1 Tax=Nostoc sp. UHCC 0251 TaxID=3110240 RepID=UPI002B2009C7|nr:hypothetical protein [Nostoc sp. UHCC 0251]MEA5622479.1 hypothetical protein [Nostoc sp. UHCC 0251]